MSSGFITETEILEARRRRQEEWEKVRTEDQPKEAPEEAYDTRPLFQRLEEQRMKKEMEYEEAHKLKNMIRGLDDDEVGFLDLVERSKAKAAQQISLEEQKEMQEFRERVSTLAESEEMQRLRAQLAPARPSPPAPPSAAAHAQKNKLQGVVVRKRKASEIESENKDKDAPSAKSNGIVSSTSAASEPAPPQHGGAGAGRGALLVAGVLPGLGARGAGRAALPGLGGYDTDSSSGTDDSSDIDCSDKSCGRRDLLGRRADHADADTKRKEESKS